VAKHILTLVLEKETKGTYRYAEKIDIGENPVIRTLYVAKPAAELLGNPKQIRVTIEAE